MKLLQSSLAAALTVAIAIGAAFALSLGVNDPAAGVMLLATAAAVPGPEELKRALDEHSNALKAFMTKIGNDVQSMKDRMLDLEQKGAHRVGGGGGVTSAAMLDALEKCEDLKRMASRALKGNARIVMPGGSFETKTAVLGPVAAGAAALQYPDSSSGIQGPAQRRLTVRGLLPMVPTVAGATQYTRMTAFTNAAAAQGAGSSPAEREGQAKPESAMTFELKTAPIVTIAHWIPASDQVLNDMAMLKEFIFNWMTYGVALEEEDQLLNGSGSGGEIEGLLAIATAFDRHATADSRADTIRKAITQLLLSDHVCNGIVVNPRDDESLDLEKDNDGRYLAVKIDGRAWRVPVVATNSISAGQWLAGDFNSAVVRDRLQATVEISNSHSDYFTRNLVAIRAESRIGFEIHRPAGFVKGSFITPGQPG